MQRKGFKARSVGLLAGGALLASCLLPGAFGASPAQAAEKSKQYKTGAVVLGAASAILIIKGKTVPGVLAGAGAYYAYKKSKDAKQEERYGQDEQYPGDERYSRYPDDTDTPATYPEDVDANDNNNDQDIYVQYPDESDPDFESQTLASRAPANLGATPSRTAPSQNVRLK